MRRVRADRAAATRQRVLHAAVALFVERGYLETTMAAMAAAAGVAVQTLYLSFGSKAAVLEAALAQDRASGWPHDAAGAPDGPTLGIRGGSRPLPAGPSTSVCRQRTPGAARTYDPRVLRLPARPVVRDALLGVLLTIVAEVELLLSLDRVTGSALGNALSYLLIGPAVGLRRRAPLLGIAFAAFGFALEPLTGPAPVATPFLVLLFLLASFGWYAGLRTGLT